MKLEKDEINLENGLQKEWIITNGIGGYASSTIIGANTRRYHGLLVAPLNPPARRTLILSKLDESVEIEGKKYNLFTNVGKQYISDGYKYIESFTKDILPIFKYQVGDISISKIICMVHEKNIVQVFYKIKNGKSKSKLTLAPILNLRDTRNMNTNYEYYLEQFDQKGKIKVVINNIVDTPIYMKISDGKYIEHKNDIFRNMFYIEEEKRGFYAEENLVVPGRFEIEIDANEEKEISFICSLEEDIEELDPKNIINNEIIRQNKLYNQSLLIDNKKEKKTKKEEETDELKRVFMTAIDNFIVYRPTFGLYTVIAGYPWFFDWARDTLISFEGLFLKTRRFDEAKEVLLSVTRDMKFGLIPNGYLDGDKAPLYNTVDSSLLLFEEVQKYVDYTGDYSFIKKEIYSKLKSVIDYYSDWVTYKNNNIYLDKDGLLYSGDENAQNTWMDAKYKSFASTPRFGKVVEINAMWYNALIVMSKLTKKIGGLGKNITIKKYEDMAEKCKKSFETKFYNRNKKCLFDYIGNDEIRPNQLFALSLSYPIINPNSEIAEDIINVVEKKLLNSYGVKTLAKGEENYVDIYEGDKFKREMSCHQGITWPWLLGVYYDALMNMKLVQDNHEKEEELNEKIEKFKQKTYRTFKKEMYKRGCIGSISELYDSRTPFAPKGAIAEAWSVAEIFRILF